MDGISKKHTTFNESGFTDRIASGSVTSQDVLRMIKEENIELVDCCFSDPFGCWHHCTFMPGEIDETAFVEGLPFDGSSIRLFSEINKSDVLMKPDPTTAFVDPFHQRRVLHMTCTVREPGHKEDFTRDPRSIAFRAIEYLRSTGIADTAYVGPEAEFFLFDDVRYSVTPNASSYAVDGQEGAWNGDKAAADGRNLGHRCEAKGYYFPTAPLDKHNDVRADMLLTMEKIGLPVEKHHHEVAQCQAELGFKALPLVQAADAMQVYKYVVKNVASKYKMSATFMPKPIFGDNGSGMHVHMSLWKQGKALFFDENGEYAQLSEMALHFIGGVLAHAPALCALGNPTTNSYKRLVPGYEAPVNLVYSGGNRSAAIRIPMYHPLNPKVKRMEFRCPDPMANPYVIFSAILMAGLDGIRRKIHPGAPLDVDIYELSEKERSKIQHTPGTLRESLDHLERDHEFLLQGNVFTKDFINAYLTYKRKESRRYETTPHPLEFVMYYQG